MPATILPFDLTGLRKKTPPAVLALLDALSVNPATTAVPTDPTLQSIGRPISEMLDRVLQLKGKFPGLPQRLKIVDWNGRTGTVGMAAESAQGRRGLVSTPNLGRTVEATPEQLDQLISNDVLGLEQPPQSAVDAIRRKLAAILGAQD